MSKPKKDSGENKKLRPIQDIAHQLRWDPRYDEGEFCLGYQDRFGGSREIGLAEFLDQSEIPWHRVLYLQRGSLRVWDREARLDQLDRVAHAEPQEPEAPEVLAESQAIFEVDPTYRSALVALPPESMWGPIQEIRQEHDRSFERWMPHINLLYGFVAEAHFESAAAAIAEVLRDVPPIAVSLRELRCFHHSKTSTVWLAPEISPEGELHRLQRRLQALFPRCDEQSKKSPAGFTPHLTLARFPRHAQAGAERHIAQWQAHWQPITFELSAIHLISRREDRPFAIREEVALAGIPRPPARVQGALQKLHDAWDALPFSLPPATPQSSHARPGLYLTGSHFLGVADEQSDLDVLAIVPEGVDRGGLFEELKEGLEVLGGIEQIRKVEDAFVPTLKWESPHPEAALQVDLLCATLPAELLHQPFASLAAKAGELPDIDRRSLWGRLENDALLGHLQSHQAHAGFRRLLSELKPWLRRRDLNNAGLGFPGSFSWSIAAAWHISRQPDGDLSSFFAALDGWDPRQPIALNEVPFSPHPKRDRLPILSPLAPHDNTARQLTLSTLEVLQQEWRRGRDPQQRQEALDPHAQHPHLLALLPKSDDEALEGWIKGQFLSLLLALEARSSVPLRPYSSLHFEGLPRACMGLGIGNPHQQVPLDALRDLLSELEQPWAEKVAFRLWSAQP